jgi:carotenoid cleavage dioxygenase-like enzyme
MMQTHPISTLTAEQQHAQPSAAGTLNDLGEHVYRLAALLRAAVNTGAGEAEDEGWLIGLAYDEAARLEQRYKAWAYAPSGEVA